MKLYLLICLVTFSVQAQEFLTTPQKEQALFLLDNICGDTWCEGDYNFLFDKIKCDKKSKSCMVDFTMIETNYPNNDDTEVNFCYSTSCKIEGINSYRNIAEDKNSLTDYFYEKFGDCILEKEAVFSQNRGQCSEEY